MESTYIQKKLVFQKLKFLIIFDSFVKENNNKQIKVILSEAVDPSPCFTQSQDDEKQLYLSHSKLLQFFLVNLNPRLVEGVDLKKTSAKETSGLHKG